VPLIGGERVVGVFGLLSGPVQERPNVQHPHLTSRQVDVLHLLEQGLSTKQIAQ
jgi:DNA-binding NarL/FixJ family response regulator